MHRPFISWLNSIISQRFFSSKFKLSTYFLRLSSRRKSFELYEKNVRHYKGLHVYFDDLFFPNKKVLNNLCELFGENFSIHKWEVMKYDLYGSLKNFNQTFTKNDDNINYLSSFSKFV